MSASQVIYNSQLIVSNVQMFVVLVTVCVFGIIFGIIQASMDPENHKSMFAIMFSIQIEINASRPIGMWLGAAIGCVIELLRQKEIQNRPKGKNALEQKLGMGA